MKSLSTEQWRFVNDESPFVILNSVAGSGKSFCLNERLKLWKEKGLLDDKVTLLLCFGKKDVLEWKNGPSGSWIQAKTCHSIANTILGQIQKVRPDIYEHKYKDIFKLSDKESSLLSKIRCKTLFNSHSKQDLMEFIEEQCIFENVSEHLVEKTTKKLYEAWRKGLNLLSTTINYDDMLYGPLELLEQNPELKSNIKVSCDLMVVDEFQDLSPFEIEIAKLLDPSMAFAAGDKFQALYNFKLATGDDLENWLRSKDVKEFSLTETRRVSKSVSSYVSKTFDMKYTSHRSCRQGSLNLSNTSLDVSKSIKDENTTFICRSNAPLVELGLKLMEKNIDFYYRQDITNKIVRFLKKNGSNTSSLAKMNRSLKLKYDKRIRLMEARQKILLDNEQDLFETSIFLTGEENQKRFIILKNLLEHLENLSQVLNSKRNCIMLSTIHSYKGRENQNIVCIDYWQLYAKAHDESNSDQYSDQKLLYVALTRTKENFYAIPKTLLLEQLECSC